MKAIYYPSPNKQAANILLTHWFVEQHLHICTHNILDFSYLKKTSLSHRTVWKKKKHNQGDLSENTRVIW